jgi:hypothetical protein
MQPERRLPGALHGRCGATDTGVDVQVRVVYYLTSAFLLCFFTYADITIDA